MARQLKLGAFLVAPGHHAAAWRHPGALADRGANFAGCSDDFNIAPATLPAGLGGCIALVLRAAEATC